MKNIFLCVVLLLIYMDPIEGPDPDPDPAPDPESSSKKEESVPIIRAPVPLSVISSRLLKIDRSLQIPGAIENVDPTQKETLWIKRFIKTMKNWLGILTEVSKLDSYINGYYDILKYVYDECIYGDNRSPIQVRYRKDVGTETGKQTEIYAYNFIPFWVCATGFGLGEVNVKLLDIHFERSKKKRETPDGQTVRRKDKVYDAEIEITAPWVIIRIDHEIVQWGEEPDQNETKTSNGVMRVKLNDVKIVMSMRLIEIDKRFVQQHPDTGLTYYFRLPELKTLSLSVDNIQRYNNEIQKKTGPEGEYVGKGINTDRAEKIIVDLTDLFESKEGREEICNRLKPILVNRSAEAIMTAPDVLSIAKNVVIVWDEIEPKMPPVEWKNDEINLWHEAFYAGYDTMGLVAKALNFIITHFQNIRSNKKVPDVNVLGNGPPSEYNVGDISVHDNGFDFSEKSEKKTS